MVAGGMEQEFAPQYSAKERRRLQIMYAVICVLMAAALYWWVLPRIRLLAVEAPCAMIFGVRGSAVLLYSALVGAPLMGAVFLVAMTARSSIHAIATRRYPPPGQKVFGRVKVKKGKQAVAMALVPAMFVTAICLLSIEGMHVANKMIRDVQRSVQCGVSAKDQALEPPTKKRQDSTPRSEHRRPSR